MLFTGYIPRATPNRKAAQRIREDLGIDPDEKLVVLTTGGGGDGYSLMDIYLSMLEQGAVSAPIRSVLVTGPFMPREERKIVFRRARRQRAASFLFFRQMEKLMAAADLVVSMGGYNTLSEVLSQGTPSLVIPREKPRLEQLIRARTFHAQGLVDYIPRAQCTPVDLGRRIQTILDQPQVYREALARFRFTGIDTMRSRIDRFRSERNVVAC
jgi:predicted glycosyltransferase